MSEQKTITHKESYSKPTTGHATRRLKNKILPMSGQNFSPKTNRKLQFRLPAEWLDNAESFLSFVVKHKNADGSNTAITDKFSINGAYQYFQSMRILVGGVVLEDIQNLDLIEHIVHTSCDNDDYVNGPLGMAQGLKSCRWAALPDGPELVDVSKRLIEGTEFIFKPKSSGWFNTSLVTPLPYMPEVILEFTLQDDILAINSNGGATTYTYEISEVALNIENVEYSQDFVNGFESSLSNTPLQLYFQTCNAFNQAITGGSTDLTIGQFRSNLISMLSVYREQSVLNQKTDSLKCGRNGITDYQLSLGSLRINQDYVSNSITPYKQARHLAYYTQCLSSISDGSLGMNVLPTDTTNSKGWSYDYWGIGVDMEVSNTQLGGIDSTITLGAPLVLAIKNAGASTNTSFTFYGCVCTLSQDRSISITF